MEYRSLGGSRLQTAPLISGGNILGWTIDEQVSFQVLYPWLDAGINRIDTADVCPGGRRVTSAANRKS